MDDYGKLTINGREVSGQEWEQIKEDGIYLEYNEDGNVYNEVIVQGKKYVSRFFDRDGHLTSITKWLDDDNMIEKSYDKNGIARIEDITIKGEERLDMKRWSEKEKEFVQLIIFGEV